MQWIAAIGRAQGCPQESRRPLADASDTPVSVDFPLQSYYAFFASSTIFSSLPASSLV